MAELNNGANAISAIYSVNSIDINELSFLETESLKFSANNVIQLLDVSFKYIKKAGLGEYSIKERLGSGWIE
jgi:hypothetical protein